MERRMDKLLDAVNGDGRAFALYGQQTFDPEDRIAVTMQHQ